jgi:isocitrate lyase
MAVLKRFYDKGVEDVNGHLLYRISDGQYQRALDWLEQVGALGSIDAIIEQCQQETASGLEASLNSAVSEFHEIWEEKADLKTFGEAVVDRMTLRAEEGASFDLSPEEWLEYSKTVSLEEAAERAQSMGLSVIWDCEMTRTPEGYYQVRVGIEHAISNSLATAPFADLIWMETKTADLEDARKFAEAIHAEFPEKMLAYNLSPSFNWDTTGMTDEEMRDFPEELGKLGYVFNFITYGGHQIDGLAAEDFATALRQDGMLALARLQRKFRLLDSPYRTPQTLVGGPRLDAALAASSGRTASTKAMGKGSTQRQHLVETEIPPKFLEEWLKLWAAHYQISGDLRVCLKPFKAGSDLLTLTVSDSEKRVADIVFTTIHDRHNRPILSVRDQNTLVEEFRKKRLMTLIHLFVIHRYNSTSVHYVSPTDDNLKQTEGMKALGIYDQINTEIGHIIVAEVNQQRISELIESDQAKLKKLVFKEAESGVPA